MPSQGPVIWGERPGIFQGAILPGSLNQTVSVTGTSQVSQAFSVNTTVVRAISTSNCYLAFGASPVASATSLYLPANTIEYYGVGGSTKVAVLQVAASGTLYLSEGT
jgi:hypothetical protein